MSEPVASEEYQKQRFEILETACCYNSIQDEVLKLICLFQKCYSNKNENGEDFLTRRYVVEKAMRILLGIPIILDQNSLEMFVSLKMEKPLGEK